MEARAFPGGTGCAIGKPRPRLTHPESFIFRAGRWGVLLFGFFLLDKQEKETRPPLRRSKPSRQR